MINSEMQLRAAAHQAASGLARRAGSRSCLSAQRRHLHARSDRPLDGLQAQEGNGPDSPVPASVGIRALLQRLKPIEQKAPGDGNIFFRPVFFVPRRLLRNGFKNQSRNENSQRQSERWQKKYDANDCVIERQPWKVEFRASSEKPAMAPAQLIEDDMNRAETTDLEICLIKPPSLERQR